MKYLLTGKRAGVYSACKWEKVGDFGVSTILHDEPHIPVLAQEIVGWMPRRPGAVYVDCTLGYGGLAYRLLSEADADARLIGIDQDVSALRAAKVRLAAFGARVTFIEGNFSQLTMHLHSVGIGSVDGVIMDLGVSSPQLDEAERGFSFSQSGPLDMRMASQGICTAADLVNSLSERELADVIYQYGEERFSRRIARAIVRARSTSPLRTTNELVDVIRGAVPAGYRHGRLHCATRTFQALRIAVNREMDVLREALPQARQVLAPGGRLAVVSFHSLEDRLVKHAFREWAAGEQPTIRILTRKPVEPSDEECARNPRARSAKLRVMERVA